VRSPNKITLIVADCVPAARCENCVFEMVVNCGEGIFECRAAYRDDYWNIIWKLIEETEQVPV
jgi:hypothetical protein